jgi:uncharacterized membrane protein YjjP (DUF1212 family)
MAGPGDVDPSQLQRFVTQLGAAMTSAGQPVHEVQDRLRRVATAYGAGSARVSAFPTYFMVSMGTGEAATIELTTPLAPLLRLDQVAAIDALADEAEHGVITPTEGLAQLVDIRELTPRYGAVVGILGYAILAFGLCLILHPAPRDIAAAAIFGIIVGALQHIIQRHAAFQVLLPVVAALLLSTLSALAIEHGLTGPGLPAMVAALVVFLPGVSLTNAILELAAGQTISGSSRLVAGVVQLAFLAFGILAGIELVGVPSARVLHGSSGTLGDWAPWVGVAVFTVGVHFAHSPPKKSLLGLTIILYAAWTAQVVGNAIAGAYVSAFVGGAVLTLVAAALAHLPRSMPPTAAFLPGFWLLVPGALGLVGLTKFAGDLAAAGANDLVATTVTIFAIAVGVLCGALLLEARSASRRALGVVSRTTVVRTPRRHIRRWSRRPRGADPTDD